MKVYYDLDLDTFEAWSGARQTLDRIRDEYKTTDLEYILEDQYPEGMSETELNDLLWFDADAVYSWLGMKTDEEIEREESERKEKFEALNHLKEITDASEFCDCWTGDCDMECYMCPLYGVEDDCAENKTLKKYHEYIVQAADELIKEMDDGDCYDTTL